MHVCVYIEHELQFGVEVKFQNLFRDIWFESRPVHLLSWGFHAFVPSLQANAGHYIDYAMTDSLANPLKIHTSSIILPTVLLYTVQTVLRKIQTILKLVTLSTKYFHNIEVWWELHSSSWDKKFAKLRIELQRSNLEQCPEKSICVYK